jgi:hypothetical protein
MGGMSLRRGVIALWCLVAVGCAEVTNGPAARDAIMAEPIAAAVTPPAVDAAPTPERPLVPPVATIADSAAAPVDELPVAPSPVHELPSVSPAEIAPEPSELAAAAPAAPAREALEPEPSLDPPYVAAPTVEALDFSSLVTRLRKTKAINLRTKVAVKNESDDLLDQVRAYHTRTGEATLDDLRRSYDSLFYKLHSLLEDADPLLARDIDRSRAAIWELLADPRKFSASHLMTGA